MLILIDNKIIYSLILLGFSGHYMQKALIKFQLPKIGHVALGLQY